MLRTSRLVILIAFLSVLGFYLHPPIGLADSSCSLTSIQQEEIRCLLIDNELITQEFEDTLGSEAGLSQTLYDLQAFTASVLEYGVACDDTDVLEQLVRWYLIPLQLLDTNTPGGEYWHSATENGQESILESSQFLYGAARLYNIIAEKQYYSDPSLQPVSGVNPFHEFLTQYGPILNAVYTRWVFREQSMWTWPECATVPNSLKAYTYEEYIQRKTALTLRIAPGAPAYCNMILDVDLLVASGVTEFLAAETILGNTYSGLTCSDRDRLTSFSQSVLALFENRVEVTGPENSRCNESCLLIDPQTRIDYDPYIMGQESALEQCSGGSSGSAMDISHAARIPYFLDSMYGHAEITSPQQFSYNEIHTLFAHTIYYLMRKPTSNPVSFNNYINGVDCSFLSFQSGELSPTYLGSGYARYGKFKGELATFNLELLNSFDSIRTSDPANEYQALPVWPDPNWQSPIREWHYLQFLAALSDEPLLEIQNLTAPAVHAACGSSRALISSYYLLAH